MKRARIDWEAVRNRLQASERVLKETSNDSAERIHAVYQRRAVRLATVDQRSTAAGMPVLIFRLGQERYAIELREVAETLPLKVCTPVPGASPHFRGVMNLRGELRPVVDLSRLLGLSNAEEKDRGFVLVLRCPGRQIGLMVDGLEKISEIRPEGLSVTGQGRYTQFVSGTLMILNVNAILAQVFSKEEAVT